MTEDTETPPAPAQAETPEASETHPIAEPPEAHDAAAEPAPEPAPEAVGAAPGPGPAHRGVDAAIIDAINQLQTAVIHPDAVRAVAEGKAYQLVALSAALAVQDATDMLRNNTMIASTASGVALGALIATGDPRFETSIALARKMMTDAIVDYEAIAAAAARLIASFPSGQTAAESPVAPQ